MNDYQKSIDWPRRTKSVEGISYIWLIQIILSACIYLFPFSQITCQPIEQRTLKNVNTCQNTKIYSYLVTSGGQSYNLYLNVVHFRHLWQLKIAVFLHILRATPYMHLFALNKDALFHFEKLTFKMPDQIHDKPPLPRIEVL